MKPHFMDGPMLLTVPMMQALCRDWPGQPFRRAVCVLKFNGTCRSIISSDGAGALQSPARTGFVTFILDTTESNYTMNIVQIDKQPFRRKVLFLQTECFCFVALFNAASGNRILFGKRKKPVANKIL